MPCPHALEEGKGLQAGGREPEKPPAVEARLDVYEQIRDLAETRGIEQFLEGVGHGFW